MAKRGAHSAQAHAADRYSNGGWYWNCGALEFCSSHWVVHVGFLQQVQVQSWCWPVAELESSALAAYLALLIVHHDPVVHVCIHHPAQRAEFAKTRYVSRTPHVKHIFWNTCQSSASPLRSQITLFRCADVHYSPFPHPPLARAYHDCGLICIYTYFLSNLFWKIDSLYAQFCGSTVCFTRRYFSYKECTCEISCTKFCTVRGYYWRKRGGRIIFCTKRPKELCTTDVQSLAKLLWVQLNTLTLYVKWTYSFQQPYRDAYASSICITWCLSGGLYTVPCSAITWWGILV